MSAVLVLTQGERVSLFSDAACYSPDGVLQTVRSKMTVLAEPACAVAVRGHAVTTPPEWAPPSTFDGVASALPQLVDLLAAAASRADVLVEVVAVGRSESRDAFEGWGASNIPPGDRQGVATLDGYRPGESIRLPATWGAPGWDPALAPTFGERWRGVPREQIDPERFGVDALQAARISAQWDTPEGEPIAGAIVGGFLEMAQVARHGASRRVLGSWPDRVGAMIDRAAALRIVAPEADVRAAFLQAR